MDLESRREITITYRRTLLRLAEQAFDDIVRMSLDARRSLPIFSYRFIIARRNWTAAINATWFLMRARGWGSQMIASIRFRMAFLHRFVGMGFDVARQNLSYALKFLPDERAVSELDRNFETWATQKDEANNRYERTLKDMEALVM